MLALKLVWLVLMILDGTALGRGRFFFDLGQKGRVRLSSEEIERSPGAVLGLAREKEEKRRRHRRRRRGRGN